MPDQASAAALSHRMGRGAWYQQPHVKLSPGALAVVYAGAHASPMLRCSRKCG